MRRWFVSGFAIASLALLLSEGGEARALHIVGFNLDRGGSESFGNPDMTGLRGAIKAAFPGTKFILKSTINANVTANDDVIVRGVGTSGNSAIVPLSQDEQAALVQFATDGGTLLLFADNATFDPNARAANASLLSPFGAKVTGILDASQSVTLVPRANPVANGPFGKISSISTFFPGWFTRTGTGRTLGRLDSIDRPAIAYLAPGALGTGSGAVVMFSDSSILVDDMRSSDTTTAILNALALTP